jgi:two-component system NtrC family sensor kinase
VDENILNFADRGEERHTVLVVDDEVLLRGVLKEILKDCGFHVVAVESAEQAIWYLSKLARVDVVFSDIKMPGVDGFELAKWIHQHKPDIPVILASGYSGKTNMAADLCGAQFVPKPYGFDELANKIRETAKRKRPLDP